MIPCGECIDGKLMDERHEDYDKLDKELTRLVDSGQFSYAAAFRRAIRLYPAVMECPDCQGTGKHPSTRE
ncbi:hypothetical protein [Bacillus testis]|uniref:hypothetical protein n=1 Tax=Bacillus testis TaxID=1622072 RepID=UPI00067F3597|nr:hypothetical protein [Bacillus testis]